MKTVLSLLVVVAALTAYAGPEDHISNQVCYGIETSQANLASEKVPSEICLESLQIDTAQNKIYVYSYFTPNFYTNLKLTSLVRQTEDFYRFSAANVLFNEWNSGCGDGQSVELQISGLVDFNGEGNISNMKISVVEEQTNDTCHSEPQQTVFNYNLK